MKAGKKQGMSSLKSLYDSEGKFEDFWNAVRMAHKLADSIWSSEVVNDFWPFVSDYGGREFYVNRVAKNEYAITVYDGQTKVFKSLNGGDITKMLGLQKASKE